MFRFQSYFLKSNLHFVKLRGIFLRFFLLLEFVIPQMKQLKILFAAKLREFWCKYRLYLKHLNLGLKRYAKNRFSFFQKNSSQMILGIWIKNRSLPSESTLVKEKGIKEFPKKSLVHYWWTLRIIFDGLRETHFEQNSIYRD